MTALLRWIRRWVLRRQPTTWDDTKIVDFAFYESKEPLFSQDALIIIRGPKLVQTVTIKEHKEKIL